MKIIHLELAGFYTENMLYQTNLLSAINAQDGHETTVVSTNYRWENAKIVQTPLCERMLARNLRLIRLPYANSFLQFNLQKFRRVKGLYPVLERLQPDVILCHCTQFWSILEVIRYKKDHPEVKLYADSHTDANNSGMNWLSLHVLHRIFYRYLIQKAMPYLEKYLMLGEETRIFNRDNYGVPEALMEFYPLGGILPTPEEYVDRRTRRRLELGVGEDEFLFVHSGKLDALKRTEELLKAFAAVPNPKFHLAIIGSISEELKGKLSPLMAADSRVQYLGWKSADELMEYLCATDVYCQPGSQSATMQNAVCCGCAIMLYPAPSYVKDFDYENIIWVKTQADMEKALREIATGSIDLSSLKENSNRCARELLDYQKLAARLYR